MMRAKKSVVKFEEWYFKHWHRYHEKAYTIQCLYYDVLRWASNKLQLDLLNGKKKMAIDCGCAHGYVVALLRILGYEAYGIDLSWLYLLQYAKNPAQGNLICCDVHQMSIKNEKIHLVTAFELIEHLNNQKNFLLEVGRILKPSGVFVATTPLGLKVLDMNYMLRSRLFGYIYFRNPNIEGHVYEFPLPKILINFVKNTNIFSEVISDIVWLMPAFLSKRKYMHVKAPTLIVPTLRLACIKR
ncbi:MAG: class I SAM-dependent methyltransferase [Candidatus Bathyarchaeia archaeon]